MINKIYYSAIGRPTVADHHNRRYLMEKLVNLETEWESLLQRGDGVFEALGTMEERKEMFNEIKKTLLLKNKNKEIDRIVNKLKENDKKRRDAIKKYKCLLFKVYKEGMRFKEVLSLIKNEREFREIILWDHPREIFYDFVDEIEGEELEEGEIKIE
ncbi:hypothetical protein TCON_1389 [Astathelohania contejeani]|uniref:Uncharacterized protein n=1 Tax=Astathelohania contejeani TaxID=164912 RepID=A0ABQ7HZ64_9MICR|nr:hypothetical protein TCON_1389 [Thelohania contejeani]